MPPKVAYIDQSHQPWFPMAGLNASLAPSQNTGGTVNNANRYERDTLVPYLETLWPNLNDAEKQIARDYMARWGPAAKPTNPAPNTEEFVRAKFWRKGASSPPRCHTCFVNHSVSVSIQRGQNGLDVLPCGCNYEEALVEQWAIGCGAWNTYSETTSKTVGMGTARKHIVAIVRVLLDGNIMFNKLVDRQAQIESIRRAKKAHGNKGREVTEWPDGS